MDATQANASNLDNLKTSRNGKSNIMIMTITPLPRYSYIYYIDINISISFLSDEEKAALPLLSESLVLDNLWETLSACLLELEYTPDHHAVLVLQVRISL